MRKDIKTLLILLAIIFMILIGIAIYWVLYLNYAHSSFENYYNFRGCVSLINKTVDYGYCRLKSGDVIKLVKYQGRWFLDGDLPGSGLF